ncbi:anhydro-N-acetylmuramic acid kinase [uncultured Aquimonas sp.]|uniref:anhydro-N-acetylmuramic acid kinase n=1 Tax=uncultured Aquimonas sp. TaxID=385483 RepID=UPI00086A37BF|nr:anhydro-N-acetylmuramic acid kinase [uncultured Aquimonas sp.]ODU43339.1 MAG: anhydro-N-acetylmuramic acid kinase [Xanthomonadaceae bacterium SCN 69-123]
MAAGEDGLYLGLISGTSADGIDVAAVDLRGARVALVAGRTYPWDATLRAQILRVSQHEPLISLDEFGELETAVADAFAESALRLIDDFALDRSAVRAIGSHGQTLRHRPSGPRPFTLQIGDPSRIAERAGCTVVADFRRRDVAAGGQGAPLVPAFHRAVFSDASEARAVLNIGGIANLSLLGGSGTSVSADVEAPVLGFDCGPGNGLMDAWCLRHRGQAFDAGGAFAGEGEVHAELLQRLLADAYLEAPPPKSSGRDRYHLAWLESQMAGVSASPADVQATLLEFTAASIAQALARWQPQGRRVLVCGGGVHNPRLLARLAARLPGRTVESTAAHGVDPDFVEAMTFAWLARATLAGRAGNLSEATGAAGPRVLGGIFPA